MRGTENTARPRGYAVSQLGGEVERPKYLKGRARRQFDALVEKFQRRGQQVVGLEPMIAVYAVQLTRWEDDCRAGRPWTAADLNALKALAVQFYDTAAAQVQSGLPGSKSSGNQFEGHGKRRT